MNDGQKIVDLRRQLKNCVLALQYARKHGDAGARQRYEIEILSANRVLLETAEVDKHHVSGAGPVLHTQEEIADLWYRNNQQRRRAIT